MKQTDEAIPMSFIDLELEQYKRDLEYELYESDGEFVVSGFYIDCLTELKRKWYAHEKSNKK